MIPARNRFGGVAGVYQKHTFRDEMAEALERWGQHVLALGRVAPYRGAIAPHAEEAVL